jgi:lipopolysaccharide/colanic/teichoic acid biosynthesis glycosyltransferase
MIASRTQRLRLKRLLDIVFAASGLVALSPLLLVTAIAIRVSMGRPVLYRQQRPGLEGKAFELIKFRTMRPELDERGRPVPQEERPTPLGYWLRKTSLDEIPELWAILKGDMSLVGPRPLLMEYLPLYTPEQARRHEAKPGLTGLAQVMGRHTLSWDRRFAYDLHYVDHWSLRLDAWIMLATIRSITSGDGRRPANYFTGSAPPRHAPPQAEAVATGAEGSADPSAHPGPWAVTLDGRVDATRRS